MKYLDKKIKLEELITIRESMIIANKEREIQGYAVAYHESSFVNLANEIKSLLDNDDEVIID